LIVGVRGVRRSYVELPGGVVWARASLSVQGFAEWGGAASGREGLSGIWPRREKWGDRARRLTRVFARPIAPFTPERERLLMEVKAKEFALLCGP